MESMDLSPLVVLNATKVIKTGDRDAILEALEHGGAGKLVKKNALPVRLNLSSIPSYRRWNTLPPSKKVSPLIHGTIFEHFPTIFPCYLMTCALCCRAVAFIGEGPRFSQHKQKPVYPVHWDGGIILDLVRETRVSAITDRRLNVDTPAIKVDPEVRERWFQIQEARKADRYVDMVVVNSDGDAEEGSDGKKT